MCCRPCALDTRLYLRGKRGSRDSPPDTPALPSDVHGIVFLSGGQTSIEATDHLSRMNSMGPHPWELSFSYGRALQHDPLITWNGSNENRTLAQETFLKRAKLNGLARYGNYNTDME